MRRASGCWSEEEFLNNFGNMKMGNFMTQSMYSAYISSIDGDVNTYKKGVGSMTVRESYFRLIARSPGQTRYIFASGRDDAEMVIVRRKCDLINIKTKPNGESRCWLETGTEQVFESRSGESYRKWVKSQERYPQHDSRLEVERLFLKDYIRWSILVAIDYPNTIRLVSKGPIIREADLDTTERNLWIPGQGLLTAN